MNIVDKFNNGHQGVIYTVELEPDYLVDVAVAYESGVTYTMQNEDGSTVYGVSGHDETYPDYEYDESLVIDLVNEVDKYIFEDELMLDDHLECIDGYLWATDNLIDRFCQQKGLEWGTDIVDDINFYAIYHVGTQTIEIAGTYWVCFDENMEDDQKSFTLDLTPEEADILMIAMNMYCKQHYRKNCLELVNALRAKQNLPLLHTSTDAKEPLHFQIQDALIKSGVPDSSYSKSTNKTR